MKETLRKHLVYYLSLFIFFSIGFLLLSQFSFEKRLQGVVGVLIIIIYVVWALVHHMLHHNLTSKIVIEYVLMGSLGITLILFLLRGVGL